MKVLLAGATGLTGGFCLRRLLDESAVKEVVCVGRRATGITHPKLLERLFEQGRVPDLPEVDAFISCLGTTRKAAGSAESFRAIDLDLPLLLAREVRRKGCEIAAVVSAIGASPRSLAFYSRTKGLMEAGMRGFEFRSLSILRPSVIEGPRAENRPAEKIGLSLLKLLRPVLGGPLADLRAVKAETIGSALVQAVLSARPGTRVYSSSELDTLARAPAKLLSLARR
jgi:uncharacterized protein YbjT (DUF2867 family)